MLELSIKKQIEGSLQKLLHHQIQEFLSRPSKNFRERLVVLSAQLISSTVSPKKLQQAGRLIEKLHAGSLIIDDVQDDSEERRKSPALHRQIGIPSAINVGNALYFQALREISIWETDPIVQSQLLNLCIQQLDEAHQGQALDLGINVKLLPQSEVSAICLASLYYKTGALTALATGLGAILAGADRTQQEALKSFGYEFGVALQMCDDAGNTLESAGIKRFEDLRLGRPSALWKYCAEHLSATEYELFRAEQIQAPALASYVSEIRAEAWERLGVAMIHLESRLGRCSELKDLAMSLLGAYV